MLSSLYLFGLNNIRTLTVLCISQICAVSIHPLKRHIIEYTGLKADSEKRGLGSSIEIKKKICRLEKSVEGSKASAINNGDNKDEIFSTSSYYS